MRVRAVFLVVLVALGLAAGMLWWPEAEVVELGPGAPPVVPGLESAQIARHVRGEALYLELGCGACHGERVAARPAPDLQSAGSRIDPRYLESFLANPHASEPGTTMPDMLATMTVGERTTAARALAHFVRSLDDEGFERAPVDRAAAERGGGSFATIGCIVCHDESELLSCAAAKYGARSLQAFLLAPREVRPGGRMPNFDLSPAEANDLSHFLVARQDAAEAPRTTPLDERLIARGRELALQLNCASCHQGLPTGASPVRAADLTETTRGCLSGKRGDWPFYALTPEQIADLRSVTGRAPSDEEKIEIALASRNCYGCHERNGIGGVSPEHTEHFHSRDVAIGEEGRLPPPLTGVGAKLQKDWLVDAIAFGQAARPYLVTRMPGFGEQLAADLAGLLEQTDSLPEVSIEPLPTDRKKREEVRKLGAELVGDQGMNCISCHTFAGEGSGTMAAIDLVASTGERLRPEWFHHFMKNPVRFRPDSFMPRFFLDGKSLRPELGGGEPDAQIAAMWHYLSQGRNTRKPRGLSRPPIELTVADEAVMLRRAVQNTGKRGISVGYPGGVNLTFNAESLAVNQIWWGKFVDAGPVWRGQGSGQARILSRDRIDLGKGPPFCERAKSEPWPASRRELGHRFLGYDLDAQRRPTFRYECHGIVVRDALREVPGKDRPRLRRTLSFEGDGDLVFRAALHEHIEEQGPGQILIGNRLVVRLPEDSYAIASGEQQSLTIPVNGLSELVLEYEWREGGK